MKKILGAIDYKNSFLNITILILCLLSGIGAFFLQKEIKSYQDSRDKLAQEAEITDEEAALFSRAKIIDELYLNEDELIDFIRAVEEYRIYFNDLSLNFKEDKPSAKANVHSLPFSLAFTSEYEKGFQFIKKLLKSPMLVEVQNFEVSGKEGISNQPKFLLDASIYVSSDYSL